MIYIDHKGTETYTVNNVELPVDEIHPDLDVNVD